ncbi:MAG: HNH endonuclease [Loktanella sp.]|nr:HNH endonuclease [Loktanella sp.]
MAWQGDRGTRHQRGYGHRWVKLRDTILQRDGHLCIPCLHNGRPTPAKQVDHITPKSQGGTDEHDNLQSICVDCHKAKTASEAAVIRDALRAEGKPSIGDDGWVTLPTKWGYSIPHGLRPSAIPVTIICGPPASGKTTYAHEHAAPTDKIIDLDEITQRIGGKMWETDRAIIRRALSYRDVMIRSLADAHTGAAWFIVTGKTAQERKTWLQALGEKARLVVMDTPKAVCIERILAEPRRADAARSQILAVDKWQ